MHDDLHSLIGGPQPADAEDEPIAQTAALSVPAETIVDEAAQEIAKAALARVGELSPWLGPLLEAVACGATGPAKFATSWGPLGPTPDPEKHAAYVAAMKALLEQTGGWLLPLLDAAGAVVIVSPGVLCFMVSHLGAAAFDIPQLLPLTRLTPWVGIGESMH